MAKCISFDAFNNLKKTRLQPSFPHILMKNVEFLEPIFYYLLYKNENTLENTLLFHEFIKTKCK